MLIAAGLLSQLLGAAAVMGQWEVPDARGGRVVLASFIVIALGLAAAGWLVRRWGAPPGRGARGCRFWA